MESRKVVVVLLEGDTDNKTTFPHVEFLIEESNPDVNPTPKVISYDITNEAKNETFRYIDRTKIRWLLNKKIKEALSANGFTKDDLLETILIIDIDGVYINDVLITENKDIDTIFYKGNGIDCQSRDGIIKRNDRKRDNIFYILNYVQYALNKPLTVYYYSCNSEHVLYNKINCSKAEKNELARKAIDVEDNDFWNIIKANSLSDDYKESWDKLECIQNEIPRATNLNVLYLKYKKDDSSEEEQETSSKKE